MQDGIIGIFTVGTHKHMADILIKMGVRFVEDSVSQVKWLVDINYIIRESYAINQKWVLSWVKFYDEERC